jgi:hypothetical protein
MGALDGLCRGGMQVQLNMDSRGVLVEPRLWEGWTKYCIEGVRQPTDTHLQ